MGLELLTQQRKGTVVLNDKDARAVHGVHLLQQVDQSRRLASARGSKEEHVNVLFPVGPVQGIEYVGFCTAVEKDQAVMPLIPSAMTVNCQLERIAPRF